ncbi:acyl-CoA thioesterase [Modestobacter sp. SYSU DS0875]
MPEVWSAPVRFVECDRQGVVFNGHYLTWADEALGAWWRAVGVDWTALNAAGVEYYVRASALEWTAPARHGDVVAVDADLERLGTTSVTLRFTVRVAGRTCCTVRSTYVVTTAGRPVPWPDDVRALLTAPS